MNYKTTCVNRHGHSQIDYFFLINFCKWNREHFLFSLILFIYFIYGCVGSSFLCEGLPQLRQAGGHSSSRCAGLSLLRPLSLRSTGSRYAGSATVAHGPSCSAARGILPDQGLNPCPLHWQADPQPLCHQGSPHFFFIYFWSDLYYFYPSANQSKNGQKT